MLNQIQNSKIKNRFTSVAGGIYFIGGLWILTGGMLPLSARAQSNVIVSQWISSEKLENGYTATTQAQDVSLTASLHRAAFVELVAPDYYPVVPMDKSLITTVYHYALLPTTENKLSGTIAIGFTYPLDEARFKEIFIYNEELGRWTHLAGSIDEAQQKITARTNWASGFIAVFADHIERSDLLKEKLNAPSILVVDAKTGEILLERNSAVVRPIASLTKLMTAAEFLEHSPGWSKRITMIGTDDTIPAKIYVTPGDVFTTHDLFYATLLPSANNAARALARATGLSRESFVSAMNERAKILGMDSTAYVEPTGLAAENVSTAQDLYKLSRSVFADMEFLKATTPKTFTIESLKNGKQHVLTNTNKAMNVPYVVLGSKTGYTIEAGRNVIMKARNSAGREVIAITLGGTSPGAQWDDMRILLDAALGEQR